MHGQGYLKLRKSRFVRGSALAALAPGARVRYRMSSGMALKMRLGEGQKFERVGVVSLMMVKKRSIIIILCHVDDGASPTKCGLAVASKTQLLCQLR